MQKEKKKKVNSSMGKMREIFNKTGDIKGTFHASMAMIKDINSKDLTQKQKRLGRGGKNTEELYKKGLNDLISMMVWSTHQQPDILECKVKGALGRITTNKASGGNKVSAELFKILKDYVVKVLYSVSKSGQLSTGHHTGKGQFSVQSQIRAIPKNVQTTV